MLENRFLKLILAIFGGLLTFEVIAYAGWSLRPRSAFAPMSLVRSGADAQLVFTDKLGTRSSLDRGEPRKWGAVGTSVTVAMDIAQDDLWSRRLEFLYPPGQLHVENFSNLGSFESMNQMILEATERGQRFEVFLIMATLVYRPLGQGEIEPLFQYSKRWRDVEGRFPLSYFMLRQILKNRADWPPKVAENEAILAQLKNRPHDASDQTITYAEATVVKDCYVAEMKKRRCDDLYFDALKSETAEAAWVSTFRRCQDQADKACYATKRTSAVDPSILNKNRLYRHQLKTMIDNASRISDHVYVLTQPINTTPEAWPTSLVSKNATGMISIEYPNLRHILLDNEAGMKQLELRNKEVREAAEQIGASIIDLNEELLQQRPYTNPYFLDYAHMSPKGHAHIAQFIKDRVDNDLKEKAR